MKKVIYSLIVSSLMTFCYTNVSLAAQPTDSVKFYNKNQKDDDVIISLPCDLKMVFKKIYTSYDDKRLVDKQYTAGMNSQDDPLSQSLHKSFVQGAFKDKKGYYFLLGKYEVTQLQYDALVKDKCTKPSMALTRPIVNISWFDALNYANKLSLYLQNSNDDFIKEHKDSFVRLPTENEWEFAVRGGLLTSSAEFNALTPLLDGGNIYDYAQVNSPQSANGKLKPVGLLKPNALDLYDMLGNASEYMLGQFSITRTGRLHGQTGGIVVRGGSFLTTPAQISYALRFEKPFYFGKKEFKARDVGMRLAIGQSVFIAGSDTKVLKDQLAKLGYDSDESDNKGGNKKLVEQLDNIIAKNKQFESENKDLSEKNQEILNSLNTLKTQMIELNLERDHMRDQSIISALRLGASLCGSIASTKYTKDQRQLAFDTTSQNCAKGLLKSEKLCAKDHLEALEASAKSYNLEYAYYIGFYADHVVDTYNLYALEKIKDQLENAKLKNKNIQKRTGINSNFDQHVTYFTDMIELFNKNKSVQEIEEQIAKKCVPVKKK